MIDILEFHYMTGPIVNAVKQAYKLERINRNKDIVWSGPSKWPLRSPYIGAGCFDPCAALAAANLKYSEEDQGRDALEEIIGLAVQLGIQQGWDQASNKVEQRDSQLVGILEIATKTLEDPI